MSDESVPPDSQPGRRPVRILIADDFAEWRAQIRRILAARPEWQVIAEACNGQEAVEKVQQLSPEVILLDIGMPILNGIQAGLKIRRQCPECRIIFVTQTRDDALREAALEMGAAGYLLKQNVALELISAITAALGDHHGRTT